MVFIQNDLNYYHYMNRRYILMAITVFAAIDVGSHETAMRIYEISKNTVYMN